MSIVLTGHNQVRSETLFFNSNNSAFLHKTMYIQNPWILFSMIGCYIKSKVLLTDTKNLTCKKAATLMSIFSCAKETSPAPRQFIGASPAILVIVKIH